MILGLIQKLKWKKTQKNKSLFKRSEKSIHILEIDLFFGITRILNCFNLFISLDHKL
jgi:hypothetical protein